MRAYKDLPEWVYAAWLGGFAVASVIVCLVTPFKMPWWASVMAIVMGIFFTIPSGVVYAVSGTFVGINVITEFVIGLMIPGETVAVICFKSFGFNVMIQAITLLGDLKLGHYMHISPISMVIAQLIGTVIGILFNTGGAFFVLDNMPGLGIFEAGDWAGTSYNTFLSAAGTHWLI